MSPAYQLVCRCLIGFLNMLLASYRRDFHTWPGGRINTLAAVVEVILANIVAGGVAIILVSCLVQFVR